MSPKKFGKLFNDLGPLEVELSPVAYRGYVRADVSECEHNPGALYPDGSARCVECGETVPAETNLD